MNKYNTDKAKLKVNGTVEPPKMDQFAQMQAEIDKLKKDQKPKPAANLTLKERAMGLVKDVGQDKPAADLYGANKYDGYQHQPPKYQAPEDKAGNQAGNKVDGLFNAYKNLEDDVNQKDGDFKNDVDDFKMD